MINGVVVILIFVVPPKIIIKDRKMVRKYDQTYMIKIIQLQLQSNNNVIKLP